MPTIDLPGGGTAILRDPETLTGIDVETVMGLVGETGLDPAAVDKTQWFRLMGAIRRALVVVLTESWTLTTPDGALPLPITMDTVGALPARTLKPLYAAVTPALEDVMAGDGPDPKSVTGS